IYDGTLSSIAIVPGTDDILLGGTGHDLASGDDDFVAMRLTAYGGLESVLAPRDMATERMAAIFTDGTWAIGVGNRTIAGARSAMRARYFISPLQSDTDFGSGGRA